MDVEKATVDLVRLENDLERCRHALTKQQATSKQRASVGKAPTWRLQAAVDDAERTERYVLESSQRLKSLLRELVVQYAAVAVAALRT